MTRSKTPKSNKLATKNRTEITATPVVKGKGKLRFVVLLSIFMLVGLVIGVVYFARTPPVAVVPPFLR